MTGERTSVSFTEQLRSTVERCRAELGETGRSLEEIGLLLAQTAAEVERLSQREIQLSARLREVESNLEAYPRSEIRDAYRAVHEATLRLFMLRNQMEQLEERRQSLLLYQERLRELLVLAESQLQAVTERERGGDRRTRLVGGTGQLVSPLDILAVAERERMLVRRALEHELVQLMSVVALQVEICLQVERKRIDDLRPELLRLRDSTSEAVRGLRRTLLELAPSLLVEIGLVETLRRYLRELARVSRLERVVVTGPEQDARLAPPLSYLVYRLLQELAVRVARHPGVTELAVELRVEPAQLVAVLEAGGPATLDPLPPLDPLVAERPEQLGASLAEEAIAAERWRGTLLVALT